MSIVCFSFGNANCFSAVARNFGIETLSNDFSQRATPSCVAFTDKQRLIGEMAKNQLLTNCKNTIYGFKRLLGKIFEDRIVQDELETMNFAYEVLGTSASSDIFVKVDYLERSDLTFDVDQILGMLLAKLKSDAIAELKYQVRDCVLTVPSYFTNSERLSIFYAAEAAGLNCLQLLNETTAVALDYAYKQDEISSQNLRNVVFIDIGDCAIQVSAVEFKEKEFNVIATTSGFVGGRNFDRMLAHHFSEEFLAKYGIDPRTDKKAYLTLLSECERFKKLMSINTTELIVKFDHLMDVTNIRTSITRAKMEEICHELFDKLKETIIDCVDRSKLSLINIHSVEIVGGSTRIPFVKNLIEKIFRKSLSITLNQDEAVVRGGAIYGAMMSSSLEMKQRISIFEKVFYPMYFCLKYMIEERPIRVKVEIADSLFCGFSSDSFYTYDFSLHNRLHLPMNMSLRYPERLESKVDVIIFDWSKIKEEFGTRFNNAIKIFFSIRLKVDHNGFLAFTRAECVIEEKLVNDQELVLDMAAGRDASLLKQIKRTFFYLFRNRKQSPQQDERGKLGKLTPTRRKTTTVEIPFSQPISFEQYEQNLYILRDNELVCEKLDQRETERARIRNNLEEYIYGIRDGVQENPDEPSTSTNPIFDDFCRLLDEIESWLYGEGESSKKKTYNLILDHLKSFDIKEKIYKIDDATEEELNTLRTEIGAILRQDVKNRNEKLLKP